MVKAGSGTIGRHISDLIHVGISCQSGKCMCPGWLRRKVFFLKNVLVIKRLVQPLDNAVS